MKENRSNGQKKKRKFSILNDPNSLKIKVEIKQQQQQKQIKNK